MTVQDVKLEAQFLASLADLTTYDLGEAKKFVEHSGITEAEFTRLDHWNVYCGICKCIALNIPASPGNLARELTGIDKNCNAAQVSQVIVSDDAHGSYLDGYCDKLIEISERRQALKLIEDAQKRLLNGSDSASSVKFKLSHSLSRTRGRKQSESLNRYVIKAEQHIKDVRDGKIKPVIPTYLKKLDAQIGGWQPTLILIGAEPGVGKSALIATGVDLQAKNGHKPYVATLEDPPDFLAWRLVSNDSGMNQSDLRFRKVGTQQLEKIQAKNKELDKYREQIRVMDGSDHPMRIEDLVSSINDAIVNEGCDSVWIDHAGEIALGNAERTDLEIARHLSLLRGIANKHCIPVIVAMHLRRPSDPTLPPTFRDFANSSGAERKARVALGLRRQPGSDLLEVHIMKQTNGPAGAIVDLEFGGAAAMIIQNEGGYK